MNKKERIVSLGLIVIIVTSIGVYGSPLVSDAAGMQTKLEAFKDASINEAATKEFYIKEATTKELYTKEATTKEVTSKEATSKKGTSKEVTIQEVTTQEATTQEETIKETTAKEAATKAADVENVMIDGWESIDPIIIANYNFKDSTNNIEVKKLEKYNLSDLIETKVGLKNKFTVRSIAFTKLFNDGFTALQLKSAIVYFANEQEGIILGTNVFQFAKAHSETQSAYVTRRTTNLEENFLDNSKLNLAYFTYSGYLADASSAIITNTDTEWRGTVKIKYTGTLISTPLRAEGYLTVVFDKKTEYYGIQTYVKENPTSEDWDSMLNSSNNFKYKLN